LKDLKTDLYYYFAISYSRIAKTGYWDGIAPDTVQNSNSCSPPLPVRARVACSRFPKTELGAAMRAKRVIALLACGFAVWPATTSAEQQQQSDVRMSGLNSPVDIPGVASATGINARGDITGYVFGRYVSGFLLSNGALTTFSVAGLNTWPLAINSRGDIVGWFDDSGGSHGFLLKDGAF